MQVIHTYLFRCLDVTSYHRFDSNSLILGFRREAAENCALPGYYAAVSGYSLPTFRDNLSVPFPRFDRLSRNVGKKLSLLAA